MTAIFSTAAPLKVAEVPYFSQWESPELVPDFLSGRLRASADPRWVQSGADSPAEYEFWSWRACGVACLRMLLQWWNGDTPAAMPLVRECRAAGAYVVEGTAEQPGVRGLIDRPFCDYLDRRWGLDARVFTDTGIEDVASQLTEDRLAIISVHPGIRRPAEPPPVRGGHLVLAVGTHPGGLVIHNPSGLPDASPRFAVGTFDTRSRFFAGRGMPVGR